MSNPGDWGRTPPQYNQPYAPPQYGGHPQYGYGQQQPYGGYGYPPYDPYAPQPVAGQGYGVMPGYPGMRADPPSQVKTARILMWVQGGLYALASLIFIILTVAVAAASNADDTPFHDVGAAITAVLAVVTAIFVAVTVLIFVFAARFSTQRQGVRIGTAVVEGILGGIQVLGLIGELANGASGNLVVSALGAGMTVTIFVLILGTPARQYFCR